jgi:hypothetical protein
MKEGCKEELVAKMAGSPRVLLTAGSNFRLDGDDDEDDDEDDDDGG